MDEIEDIYKSLSFVNVRQTKWYPEWCFWTETRVSKDETTKALGKARAQEAIAFMREHNRPEFLRHIVHEMVTRRNCYRKVEWAFLDEIAAFIIGS